MKNLILGRERLSSFDNGFSYKVKKCIQALQTIYLSGWTGRYLSFELCRRFLQHLYHGLPITWEILIVQHAATVLSDELFDTAGAE
ncbi:hypothetical protein CYMTET_36536 [Cymbomonas tetramitiformis]|uniref:Uncharacterized protein n=1 Tax=Cymbomonas tetramitiformis TaxID=36881 RepID=A0AAE0F750_9CHLO|nr:hypothetical protein CYMTET_36536 [Cymbomonas tetramitiformis]